MTIVRAALEDPGVDRSAIPAATEKPSRPMTPTVTASGWGALPLLSHADEDQQQGQCRGRSPATGAACGEVRTGRQCLWNRTDEGWI
jgi:hypothetical protein